jgi:SAM-dependent methyltransferase
MTKECFSAFAPYYDLLYADKDYAGEAYCVQQILGNHDIVGAHVGDRILDLGCGTGEHMLELKKLGYAVTGMDSSPAMVDIARGKGLTVHLSDARLSTMLNPCCDAVICLFHVASYQLTSQDLVALFNTARVHLKPGGVFIFDVWDGSAVVACPPSLRVKFFKDDHLSLARIAKPALFPNENRVNIAYTLYVEELDTREIRKFQETHCLRYWFASELNDTLRRCGFEIVCDLAAYTDHAPYDRQIVARRL